MFQLNSDEEPVIFNRSGDLTSLTPSEDFTLTFKEDFKVLEDESESISQTTKTEAGKTSTSTSTDSGLSLSDLNESYSANVSKVCCINMCVYVVYMYRYF